MRKDPSIALIFSFIAVITSYFLVKYQFDSLQLILPADEFDVNNLPIPFAAVVGIAAVQLGLIVFITSLIGISLARKTNFQLPILDSLFNKNKINLSKKSLMVSILLGVLGGFTIIGSDRFFFHYHIPFIAEHPPTFSMNGLIVGVLYGGIVEEVLLRLFFMTLLVWILYKILARKKDHIPSYIYWSAIIIAAIVFVIAHFPATILTFGELSPIIIVRGFFLNGLFGAVFGYLYWKKGIEYAMISHMTAHISMQLIFIPLIY